MGSGSEVSLKVGGEWQWHVEAGGEHLRFIQCSSRLQFIIFVSLIQLSTACIN